MSFFKKTGLLFICSMLFATVAMGEGKKMSANAYRGGDKAALEKKIAAAYNQRYSTDKVIKVVIKQSGWQTVMKVENGRKVAKYYIAAEVAVDNGNDATVWDLTFEKIGGRVELFSIGESFTMKKADIK